MYICMYSRTSVWHEYRGIESRGIEVKARSGTFQMCYERKTLGKQTVLESKIIEYSNEF